MPAPAPQAAEAAADRADHDDADGAAGDEPATESETVAQRRSCPRRTHRGAAPVAVVTAAEPAVGRDRCRVQLSYRVPISSLPSRCEPKPVLLWRLGGRGDNQQRQTAAMAIIVAASRVRARDVVHQGNRRNSGGEQQASGEGNREGAIVAIGAKLAVTISGPRGNRDGGRPQHQGNRSGERNDASGSRRPERANDRNDRNDRNNRGASQPLRFEAKPPRKEKPIDPDSTFRQARSAQGADEEIGHDGRETAIFRFAPAHRQVAVLCPHGKIPLAGAGLYPEGQRAGEWRAGRSAEL